MYLPYTYDMITQLAYRTQREIHMIMLFQPNIDTHYTYLLQRKYTYAYINLSLKYYWRKWFKRQQI